MKIAVVHGQLHKGSTYHITRMLLEKLNCVKEDVSEFYVNGIGDCVGCFQCIMKGEDTCPHRRQTEDIIKALEEADIIVIDSPTYVLSVSGQLKTFLDHMGYRWISHRPYPSMKQKIGVAISTTAGAGARKTTKFIASQMSWWAVGKTYQLPVTVSAMNWEQVNAKRKVQAERKAANIAKAIRHKSGHVKPGIKARFMFFLMKQMHKGMDYNPVDMNYWKEKGWI
ncbi:flavodoxin family protein [Anaerocolumna xylanovorans]|uniref:NADPH-dependent FMN reductase n=1 Tax=Anaerocolumna xylanovorans DSM 12503 TaxID=1121345 RepID=A0A1M7YFV4_9FIRM|nr:NAD(P)H-dependent oxidoreductase [Anaerocolumna xylanovorans]SHO51537.1 NADPH-dependent FMN reductase [Anaerocolumna xylanovorans DSM 12503]